MYNGNKHTMSIWLLIKSIHREILALYFSVRILAHCIISNYSQHTCGYCPLARMLLSTSALITQNLERVIDMALHCETYTSDPKIFMTHSLNFILYFWKSEVPRKFQICDAAIGKELNVALINS